MTTRIFPNERAAFNAARGRGESAAVRAYAMPVEGGFASVRHQADHTPYGWCNSLLVRSANDDIDSRWLDAADVFDAATVECLRQLLKF
jgi:hypothetical protein